MAKRPFIQRPLGILLMTLVGGVIGALAARNGFEPPALDLSPAMAIAFIVLVPALYFVVIAAHEAGHVIGGLLAGFRPLLFIVGPLRIERTASGRREYGLNRSFAMAGGLAACTPVGTHDLRRRTLLLIAGGPIASLMFGSQCLALYQATSAALTAPGAAAVGRLLAAALLMMGVFSIFIGLATLLPIRSDGFYSDGARLLRLMRAGEDAEREVALLALTGVSMSGTRPSDWDAALVESCAGIRDGGPFEVAGRQFAYAHALDSGNLEVARAHLDASIPLIDQLPEGSSTPVLLAAATFYALHDDDPEPARALIARATSQSLLTTPHDRVLAEAAMRLADGDPAGAAEAACEAQRLIAQAPDRGGSALDYSLAGQILERARLAGPGLDVSAGTAASRSRGSG